MSEVKDKRRSRKRENFATKKRAIHITIYHPGGEQVDSSVFEECEKAVFDTVRRHGLLINRAIT